MMERTLYFNIFCMAVFMLRRSRYTLQKKVKDILKFSRFFVLFCELTLISVFPRHLLVCIEYLLYVTRFHLSEPTHFHQHHRTHICVFKESVLLVTNSNLCILLVNRSQIKNGHVACYFVDLVRRFWSCTTACIWRLRKWLEQSRTLMMG